MLQLSPPHLEQAKAIVKKPVWVAEIIWENDQHTVGINDLYFASVNHSDIVNGPPSTEWFPFLDSTRLSSISQTVDPISGVSTIGSLSFELVDKDHLVSKAIKAASDAGYGLNRQRVDLYKTYVGEDWVNAQIERRMQINSVQYTSGKYRISCSDLQRTLKKTIFEPVKEKLAVAINTTDLIIQVQDSSKFLTKNDPDGTTFGYVLIDKEFIKWTSNNLALNQLTVPTGGRNQLGGLPAAITHSLGATVQEVAYFRENPIHIAEKIMFGGPDIPPHWSLGMDKQYALDQPAWDAVGQLVSGYDPANALAGMQMYFVMTKGTDGKRFIESEILRLLGAFLAVTGEGKLKLTAYNDLAASEQTIPINAVAAPDGQVIDETVAMKWGGLSLLKSGDLTMMFRLDYDETPKGSGKFARTIAFVDDTATTKHGIGKIQKLTSLGLIPDPVYIEQIFHRVERGMARFSRPPMHINITLLPKMSALEVGDVKRVRLPVYDAFADADLNRTFEVIKTSLEPNTGAVNVDMISQPEKVIFTGFNQPFFTDSVYYIGTDRTSQWTDASGLWTAGSMTLPSGDHYWRSDLTIPNGVTLTITGTTRLFVAGDGGAQRGIFTHEAGAIINGSGGGQHWPGGIGAASLIPVGASGYVGAGGSGYFPTTLDPAGNELWILASGQSVGQSSHRERSAPPVMFPSPPVIQVIGTHQNAAGKVDAISTLPSVLQGGAGGRGSTYRNIVDELLASSGSSQWGNWIQAAPVGGAGGAGLMIMARGVFINGNINLNGAVGANGVVTVRPTGASSGGQGIWWNSEGNGGAGGGGSFIALVEKDPNGNPNNSVPPNFVNVSGGDQNAKTGQFLVQTIR